MPTSVLQYGVPVTVTFGLDTALSSGVTVPPYPSDATKYTYTATVKDGDVDRTFQLGPAGNQAAFKLSVDDNGFYPGVVLTCTNCPNYGNVQAGSMVMEMSLGIVAGASGYVLQATYGTSGFYFLRGYTDGATASPFLNEQQTGVWDNTPFTPDSDPTSSLDIYAQNNVGDANLTNRYFGVQVTVDNPPSLSAPDENLTVSGYYAPAPSTSVSVTPAITQGGNPVTPDSLAIVAPASHGTASVSGTGLIYVPGNGYSGSDTFTYKASLGGVDSNAATVVIMIAAAPDCDEIGTTSRANASAHYRTRIHAVRLMLGERRCLVANFGGAISSARTITKATWRADYGFVALMANARIESDSRSTAVDLTANWLGDSMIRCEATLDNGEVYIQPFRVDVSGDPIFMPVSQGNGPTALTVTAS